MTVASQLQWVGTSNSWLQDAGYPATLREDGLQWQDKAA